MTQKTLPTERATMTFVFLTVFLGWVGFSLPFPVFGPLFLTQDAPLLDPAMSDGARARLLGLGLALYPLGQIIGSALLGRASDRFGRRRTLMVALMLTILGSVLLAFGVMASWVALLLLGRFVAAGLVVGKFVGRFGARRVAMLAFILMGAGQLAFLQATDELAHIPAIIAIAVGITFGQTATSVLVSDAVPPHAQGRVLGLYRSVTVMAAVVAALVGGWLTAMAPGFPFMMAVLVCGVGVGFLYLPGIRHAPQ